MLGNVFFIDDTMVDEVPRRNERQCYYARGLLATAVCVCVYVHPP